MHKVRLIIIKADYTGVIIFSLMTEQLHKCREDLGRAVLFKATFLGQINMQGIHLLPAKALQSLIIHCCQHADIAFCKSVVTCVK